MDTSKEYILMCEKATEIQANRKGMNYYNQSDYHSYRGIVFNTPSEIRNISVWLPRQDQLQEIYSKWIASELGLVDPRKEIKQAFLDLCAWMQEQYLDQPFTCVPTNCFDTGEKLWLALLMQKVYGKVWNDADWVKER